MGEDIIFGYLNSKNLKLIFSHPDFTVGAGI